MLRTAFGLVLSLALTGAASPTITAPPPALNADPFYARHIDAAGIPILSSANVPDAALLAARSIVVEMLAHRPDLARDIARVGTRIAIMAEDEYTTDLPEQRHWTRPARDDPRLTRCERIHYDTRIGAMTDRAYWNARARGMGGVFTSGAAEDLLGLRSSRYYGETIFVHEFAHNVLMAAERTDRALYAAVERAYGDALAAGRWKDEYAATTIGEYWAEGTQFWFNSNRLAAFDGRRILSHRDLKAYDPALHAALGRAYGKRHRLSADPFFGHPARVPLGPIPRNTAEVC
ncbi:glycoside hydrolase [Sphingomonas sp.]|uniref:glycoside hydrolase n=1 Tax=Sphingomonas sp. TaxID=28214 RepID=UPI002DD69D28|nr:glycoside hydrolase [Sphingomonas sp.]